MAWDYGEANPFSDSGGGCNSALSWVEPAVRSLIGLTSGIAKADNAPSQIISQGKVIFTDPPYYDNIAYAGLSDFFYVWLRRIEGKSGIPLFLYGAPNRDKARLTTIMLPYFHRCHLEFESLLVFEDQSEIPRLDLARLLDVGGEMVSSLESSAVLKRKLLQRAA